MKLILKMSIFRTLNGLEHYFKIAYHNNHLKSNLIIPIFINCMKKYYKYNNNDWLNYRTNIDNYTIFKINNISCSLLKISPYIETKLYNKNYKTVYLNVDKSKILVNLYNSERINFYTGNIIILNNNNDIYNIYNKSLNYNYNSYLLKLSYK